MSYLTPKTECTAKTDVKNSRFIGSLLKVKSKSDAEQKLQEVKAAYNDATHNCWAYRISDEGEIEFRFSDEGEPSGTAGKPILESLEEGNIIDALLVVSRYFGGTKLGMGGLNRAYRKCARETISNCAFEDKVETVRLEMHFLYCFEAQLRNLLYRFKGTIEFSYYEQHVIWKVVMPQSTFDEFLNTCRDICRGEIEIKVVKE